MKRLYFLSIFICVCFTTGKAQFLSYSSESKNSSVSIGYFDNYFRFNDSYDEIDKKEVISFQKAVPAICYQNDNLMLTAAYRKFKFENKMTDIICLDGFYKISIPVSEPSSLSCSVPFLIRTSYLKIRQEDNRFENGNLGIGTGFDLNSDFDWIGINLFYNFCINYSTMNFSVDYGYSLQNEIILSIDLNNITDNYGIKIGGKFFDQKWKLSEKKYNYYHSGYGAFFGIIF